MKLWKIVVCTALLVLGLAGCGRKAAQQDHTVPPETTAAVIPTEQTGPSETEPSVTVEAAAVEQEAQALQQVPALVHRATVEAPGIQVARSGDAVIDYSNTQEGYVMVCYENHTEQRLKVQVKGPSTTYTYNLQPQQWTAFPLSDEDGTYTVVVYSNVTGTKYAAVLSHTMQVTLVDEFAPFLHSNQYVNFDAAPETVEQAALLTHGLAQPLEKVAAVYDYVVGNLRYDRELAATVKSGYLPELDKVLEKKTGICFDYAALMTGMLRSQGIPTKLVVGYAGSVYHAWISVWSESTGWVDGVIFFDGRAWQRMDPTFASSADGDPEILDFIGKGENYTAKYLY